MSMSNRTRTIHRPNPHHVAPPRADYVVLIETGPMRIKGARRKLGEIVSLSATEARYLELDGVVGPAPAPSKPAPAAQAPAAQAPAAQVTNPAAANPVATATSPVV